MSEKEILNFCIEKGLLLDKDVLSILNELNDSDSAKLIIEKIKTETQKRIITKDIFNSNKYMVGEIFDILPEEKQKNLERLKIKFGLNIEISKEYSDSIKLNRNGSDNLIINPDMDLGLVSPDSVKIIEQYHFPSKKLLVEDFVTYFKSRFVEMKNYLQEREELRNLVSINKISGNRHGVSLIGLVSEKNTTKNKNIIFEIEDLTGKIKILINKDKKELYEKATNIPLDSVIGVRGSGNSEIVFVNDIVLPDSFLPERKKSLYDENVVFIGDLHIGGEKFMEKNFLDFIEYLNGKIPGTEEEVKKIKYLFVVGDLIAGVGNYPSQEEELILYDLESHFKKTAELFKKIPKHIKIIISPGNHDGMRRMIPQPVMDEKYAWPLYELENVFVTTNPSLVNIGAKSGFPGFNVLMYHGDSFFYYADNISELIKNNAKHKPEIVMKYLLEYRHLAPTHSSVQYFPAQSDFHIIKTIPDIFLAGHMHKSGIAYHNNILIVSVSAWEELSDYQEKRGAKPDFCKVPIFNLKTRAIKILDFE